MNNSFKGQANCAKMLFIIAVRKYSKAIVHDIVCCFFMEFSICIHVFKNSPKILYVARRGYFNLLLLSNVNLIGENWSTLLSDGVIYSMNTQLGVVPPIPTTCSVVKICYIDLLCLRLKQCCPASVHVELLFSNRILSLF